MNVQVKFSKEYECWEAVFWRAKCLVDSILNEMLDGVVAVIPPENPELREKLRYEIEGARISRGKRVRRAGGLLKKLNETKIRPWTYRIKRKFIPEIEKITKKYGGQVIY